MGHQNNVNTIEIDEKLDASKKSHLTVEECLQLAEVGRFHYFLLAVCGLAALGSMMNGVAIAAALPSTKCDFNMTTSLEGVVRSVGHIGSICSSHMWGFCSDTYGRKKTLLLALILLIISSILASFSVNAMMLIVFRLLNGAWSVYCIV